MPAPLNHTIRRVRVADLVPHPENPRAMDEKERGGLQRSIERFGLVQPIVVNERSGYVVSGNQKIPLLQQAGAVEVDAVVVDLPPDEERALLIALNNPALAGDYTDEVGPLLAALQHERPDLFDELCLWDITADLNDEAEADEEEAADPTEEAAANAIALAPQPYESFNYIVLLATNAIDWTASQEWFTKRGLLVRVKDGYTGPRKSYKIGLGRVIEMRKFLAALRAADSPPPKAAA